MLAEYQNKTNIGVLVGILLQIGGNVINATRAMGDSSPAIGGLVAIIGLVVFIWGCWNYAIGKGYPGPLGLLGLLSCLGLLILVLLPDKTKK